MQIYGFFLNPILFPIALRKIIVNMSIDRKGITPTLMKILEDEMCTMLGEG